MSSSPVAITARTFTPDPYGSTLLTVARIVVLLFGLVTIVQPSPAHAQKLDSLEHAQTYRIETTDGNVVVGSLVSENEKEVVLKTKQLGKVTIQRSDIRSMEKIAADTSREGAYWYPNPQSTRYFFAPNATAIPQGQGYYQNAWILFNNVNYGVSDHFSIGAGTIPVFLFGAGALPLWVLPKVSISTPQENLHLAAGGMIGGVLGAGESTAGGILYGSATIGDTNHNATVGVGYGYSGGGISSSPVINVSGMTRITRTTYLITENYFIPAAEEANLISGGVRWAPKNFAVDFGLFRPLALETDSFIAFPWLGVTIPFGD